MRKDLRRGAMIVLTGMTIAGMGMWGNAAITSAEEAAAETTNAAEEYYLDTLYYDQLTEEERTVYGDLYEAFTKHETEFFIFTSDYSMIYKMVDAIIEEHPEMFWIGTMYFQDFDVYEWDDQKSLCKCTYLFTKEEIEKYEVELEEVSEEFLEALPENGTTYQKVKATFDYICDKTIYTEDVDDKYGQSLIGPLCYGESICVGYARALDFLLEKADISCVSIPLVQEHEANLVEIAGDVYYVDVTWGDDDSETQYQYLCPLPEDYEKEVQIDTAEFNFPDVTSGGLEYYNLQRSCFDSYDKEEIQTYVLQQIHQGASSITMKFRNEQAYTEACEDWQNDEEGTPLDDSIYDYMDINQLDSVYYDYWADDAYYLVHVEYSEEEN